MLPLINGKTFLSCTENDLQVLIGNLDYRENEYIDYKRNFSFLEINKGKEREIKKTEFKCDVCSFANVDGGYIIYGISDSNGCANEIIGIDIPDNNTDRFELDLRNYLNGIQPRIPSVQFAFIPLVSKKYVVIIYVRHDELAPYVYLEGERNYRIYKRSGNEKKPIAYSELRKMFNSSLLIEQEIMDYVRQRIIHYRNLGSHFGNSFAYFSFIPDTFFDRNYSKNAFVLEKKYKINFSDIFSSFHCNTPSIPCVDGIRFIQRSDFLCHAEAYVRNNGIIEVCTSLDEHIHRSDPKYTNGFLPWGWLWECYIELFQKYYSVFRKMNMGNRVFVSFSIIGCQNVMTENKEFDYLYTGSIDREEIICDPIEIINIFDDVEIEKVLKKVYLSYLLAIGVKHDERLKNLINELYSVDNG